jgi:hypothetical protein
MLSDEDFPLLHCGPILTQSKHVAEKQQSKVLLLYRLYTSLYFSHSRAVLVNGFSLCRLGPDEAGVGGYEGRKVVVWNKNTDLGVKVEWQDDNL